MEPLDFGDLQIQEVSVTGPDGKAYTLREASGRVATNHRNAIMASSRLGPDGKVIGVSNLASVESVFVAGCLWDEKEKNPTVTLIESWPARVQKKLYETAKELSDFSETSPVFKSLEAALSLEDAPIDLASFVQWVQSLEGREFKPLQRIVSEYDPKNS